MHIKDACLASANVLLAGAKIWLWGDGLLRWLRIPPAGQEKHNVTLDTAFQAKAFFDKVCYNFPTIAEIEEYEISMLLQRP
eukprot:616569-Prorocentrum_minimum.AAC.1